MACRCLVGLPCVCKIPVETCSVGVDQQEFDAAGLGVGTAAGGLFGLAHDDAFGRDAFGDESITDAKGALLGKVAVEGGVTGGVVVAGQQDVAAIGGVEGFDDGGDDGCVFSGDVGRCRGEVNDTRDFGGTFDIEGNEVVFVVGAGSGGRGAVSAAGRTACGCVLGLCVLAGAVRAVGGCGTGITAVAILASAGVVAFVGAVIARVGVLVALAGLGACLCEGCGLLRGFRVRATQPEYSDDEGNQQDGDGGEHDPEAGACGGVFVVQGHGDSSCWAGWNGMITIRFYQSSGGGWGHEGGLFFLLDSVRFRG